MSKYISHKAECEAEVDAAIARALEICGGTAERYAVENIARNGSIVSTRLIQSITHQPKGEDTMAVGTDVEYAEYVEYGHHQQPGRYVPAIGKRLVASFVQGKPYLKPAVEGHISEYNNIFKTELSSK